MKPEAPLAPLPVGPVPRLELLEARGASSYLEGTAMPQHKEWLRVSHGANNTTSVTVTLVEENLSVKWSVKTYTSTIAKGVAEARAGARKALAELQAALADESPENAA